MRRCNISILENILFIHPIPSINIITKSKKSYYEQLVLGGLWPPCSSSCRGLGGPSGPLLSGGNFVFLSFCIFVSFLFILFFWSFLSFFVFFFFVFFCIFFSSYFLLLSFLSFLFHPPFCCCCLFCIFFVFFVYYYYFFLSFLSFCLFAYLSFCLFVFLYSIVQYGTVQYSTVTGEEDGVRGWLTPYSTPFVVSVLFCEFFGSAGGHLVLS